MTETAKPGHGGAPPALTAQQLAQRQAYILGHKPRIAPLKPEALSPAAIAVAARISAAAGGRTAISSAAEVPEIMATLLRHPALTEAIMDLSVHLYVQATLPPRDRELLALRTEWLCQSPFEWGEHVRIAKAVGLSSEEIERIAQGSAAPGWDEHDRALLRAAEELHEEAMISDAVWATLATRFNRQQLVEVTVVCGHYTMAAYFENALRLKLMPGNIGLGAR